MFHAGNAAAFALGAGIIARGSQARCSHRQIPLVHHNHYRAAGLLRVAGDRGVTLRDAVFSIDDQQRNVAAFQAASRHHHA